MDVDPRWKNLMSNNPLMRFFSYDHLPQHLQDASKPFCELAALMDHQLPESAEKTVCLRKLLESKDCAVRAYLERDER